MNNGEVPFIAYLHRVLYLHYRHFATNISRSANIENEVVLIRIFFMNVEGGDVFA